MPLPLAPIAAVAASALARYSARFAATRLGQHFVGRAGVDKIKTATKLYGVQVSALAVSRLPGDTPVNSNSNPADLNGDGDVSEEEAEDYYTAGEHSNPPSPQNGGGGENYVTTAALPHYGILLADSETTIFHHSFLENIPARKD